MKNGTRFAVTRFSRRRSPRIDLTLPVEYSIQESDARRFCRSGSIGEGGVMLILPRPVSVGSMMTIGIHLPEHRLISCKVQVVWTELLTGLEQGDFKAGVRFEEIEEGELEELRGFIRGQLNPDDPLSTQIRRYIHRRSKE